MITLASINKMMKPPVFKPPSIDKDFIPPKESTMRIVIAALKQFKEVSRKRLVKFSGVSAPTLHRAIKVLMIKGEATMRECNTGKQVEYIYSYTKPRTN